VRDNALALLRYPGPSILEFDMTSGQVLFVGDDLCARANVLEHVGYSVVRCACDVDAVRNALVGWVDAVLFQCTPEPPSEAVLSMCRTITDAPILLFADQNSFFNPGDFDVVVRNLCNPRDWLPELAAMIASSRDRQRAKPPQAASPMQKRAQTQAG
jgi:hypothetical protein